MKNKLWIAIPNKDNVEGWDLKKNQLKKEHKKTTWVYPPNHDPSY